jgi:DNA-binding beta-propeller fold protein YncE
LFDFGGPGVGEGQLKNPRGLAITARGDSILYNFFYNSAYIEVIVSEYSNNRLSYFHPDGNFLKILGRYGTSEGLFSGPWRIAISPEGHIVVTENNNHRVQIFNEDGSFLHMFGSLGGTDGKLKDPHGVAIDSDGRIFTERRMSTLK